MAGKLSFDCQIWLYPQHCHCPSGDKLAGAVYLPVRPGAHRPGIPQKPQGPGHTGNAYFHTGYPGQCRGSFHDNYVLVKIYDLWIRPVLYGLLPAVAGGMEGVEEEEAKMVLRSK